MPEQCMHRWRPRVGGTRNRVAVDDDPSIGHGPTIVVELVSVRTGGGSFRCSAPLVGAAWSAWIALRRRRKTARLALPRDPRLFVRPAASPVDRRHAIGRV